MRKMGSPRAYRLRTITYYNKSRVKQKPKSPRITRIRGLDGDMSLTMTYFHTGIRTIIGAKAFHCPVRDGKEWYHLAMVIRHNLLLC